MKPVPFTHEDYRDILRMGLAQGYRFIGFPDIGGPGKRCALRHDCDNDLVAAAAMAEIEREEGVRSTFFLMLRSAMYNLLAPENMGLVRRIVDSGHWIGLHFDASVLADDSRIAAEVDRQCGILAEEFGQPIAAVSFHQPTDKILQGGLGLSCINTYDRTDMNAAAYTSDSNLVFRGGDPRNLFAEGSQDRLQVLIHPEWWTPAGMSVVAKWAEMLKNNIDLMQKSLREREKAYVDCLHVVLEVRGQGGHD